jgi:peptidoglycan/LPS O-acetylase OafA/YrhL
MYVLLSLLFFIKTNKTALKIAFVIVYLLFGTFYFFLKKDVVFNFYQLNSTQLAELGLFFLGGSFLALLNFEKFKLVNFSIVLSGILIILSEILFQEIIFFRMILWPVFIIGLGIQSTKYISDIGNKIGDLSYGVYIYGFPIQQTLMHYFKLNAIQLMLLAVPLSILFAYFSWHLVESKVLRYKDKDPLFFLNKVKLKYILSSNQQKK